MSAVVLAKSAALIFNGGYDGSVILNDSVDDFVIGAQVTVSAIGKSPKGARVGQKIGANKLVLTNAQGVAMDLSMYTTLDCAYVTQAAQTVAGATGVLKSLLGTVANGASAIATKIGNTTALSTFGAKITEWYQGNLATPVLAVMQDGTLQARAATRGALTLKGTELSDGAGTCVKIGNDLSLTNAADKIMAVYKTTNGGTGALTDEVFTVLQNGNATATGAVTGATLVGTLSPARTIACKQSIWAPIAIEQITLLAATQIGNGPQNPLVIPSEPRNLSLKITEGGAAVTAGSMVVTGLDQNGQVVSETFSMISAGSPLLVGTKCFSKINAPGGIVMSGVVGGAAATTVSIGVGDKLGLVFQPGSSVTVHKANVGNTSEAVGTVSASNGTIIPTTVANAVHNYHFWYTYTLS